MGTNGVDDLVGELFGGNVKDIQPTAVTGIADRVQQMGFSEPHSPVEKRAVVGTGGLFSYSLAGRVSQPVA